MFNNLENPAETELLHWIVESIKTGSNIHSYGYQGCTYLYQGHGRKLIVKAPMGKGLARLTRQWMLYKEFRVYKKLSDTSGVPACLGFIKNRYLVLEFIEGIPIREAKISNQNIFFNELLQVIKSLHQAGVAHSDLKKKDNLLVVDQKHPCIIDFGAAVIQKQGFAPINRFIYSVARKFDFNAWVKLKYGRRPEKISEKDRPYYQRTLIETVAHKVKKIYREIKKHFV